MTMKDMKMKATPMKDMTDEDIITKDITMKDLTMKDDYDSHDNMTYIPTRCRCMSGVPVLPCAMPLLQSAV